jgi:hypothetical protein
MSSESQRKKKKTLGLKSTGKKTIAENFPNFSKDKLKIQEK